MKGIGGSGLMVRLTGSTCFDVGPDLRVARHCLVVVVAPIRLRGINARSDLALELQVARHPPIVVVGESASFDSA